MADNANDDLRFSHAETERILVRALTSTPSKTVSVDDLESVFQCLQLDRKPLVRAIKQKSRNHKRTRRRKARQLGFVRHLGSYVIVIGFLLGVDYYSGSDYHWAYWPALAWGVGLAFHLFSLFFPEGEIEDGSQSS